jgi:hypothetical protein
MLETADDLKTTFFDTDDHAEQCVITGPNGFTRTLNVIFNPTTEQVTLYETNVEAPDPSFICREVDLMTGSLVDVKRGMTATLRGVGFTIERIAMDQVGTATVFLSE